MMAFRQRVKELITFKRQCNNLLYRSINSYSLNVDHLSIGFDQERRKKNSQNDNNFNNNQKFWSFRKMLLASSMTLYASDELRNAYCKQQNILEKDVEIIDLNKIQLVKVLAEIDSQCLFVACNRYERRKQKQFAKQIADLCQLSAQASIKRIYLCDKNDIKHIKKFQRWLHTDKSQQSSNPTNTEIYDSKSPEYEYFYLTPSFQGKCFKIDSKKTMVNSIKEIRLFSVKINPEPGLIVNNLKRFNLTSVIKQCLPPIADDNQNQCLTSFKNQVSSLIEVGMLKNKGEQYQFFAYVNRTKRENNSIHSAIKQLQIAAQSSLENSENSSQNSSILIPLKQVKENSIDQKQQTFAIKYDMLGKTIKSLSQLQSSSQNPQNSSANKTSSYDQLIELIKPRVFIISKQNFEVDLFWYVSCLQKNNQPTISINNTTEFMKGVNNPFLQSASQNTQAQIKQSENPTLEMVKLLYQRHPKLNYLILNTSQISQLIRHVFVRNKYVIFNLSSQISYEKLFLPNLKKNLSVKENYELYFKDRIQTFIEHPKIYDYVIMNKEHEISREKLTNIIASEKQQCVLRVCYQRCQQDIGEQQLHSAYRKLFKKEPKYSSAEDNRQSWKNQVYEHTYWIDAQIQNVGLQEGDYFLNKGMFSYL